MRNPVSVVRDLLQPAAPAAPPVRSVVPSALEATEELTKAQLLLHDATLGAAAESERLALARAALAAQELQERLAQEPDAPRLPRRQRSRTRQRPQVIDLTSLPRLPQARDGGPSAQRAMPTD